MTDETNDKTEEVKEAIEDDTLGEEIDSDDGTILTLDEDGIPVARIEDEGEE